MKQNLEEEKIELFHLNKRIVIFIETVENKRGIFHSFFG